MWYSREDWRAIGYNLLEPQKLFIDAGDRVALERADETSKNTLEQLLRTQDIDPLLLVECEQYPDEDIEFERVASKVATLINDEGVKPEEIVIVNLKSYQNKVSMLRMQQALTNVGVSSVLPGYVESSDIFRPQGNVTISTPFRAKGNEANIVFVINSQVVSNDFTLRARNAFFVAVTRSRGWCYISGNGSGIDELIKEINTIKSKFPRFEFFCPSEDAVKSSRSLIRKSDKELDEIQRTMNELMKNEDLKRIFLEALEKEGKN
ncbi:ATP-binding domain-containing protein [Methylovorus menthalis]|uniref:ATP-binding domain-containing protein n=1 Tax=Methylovorus menthalis TaxID=1002227 RepID=UPI001E4087F5|nr:ATP-binding domain-containing protein [Methylovorus menthalis]MCB4812024.1 ATP-binding domain-containing protein [Methylovorus menthalis]